jgi:hypothetical protein
MLGVDRPSLIHFSIENEVVLISGDVLHREFPEDRTEHLTVGNDRENDRKKRGKQQSHVRIFNRIAKDNGFGAELLECKAMLGQP